MKRLVLFLILCAAAWGQVMLPPYHGVQAQPAAAVGSGITLIPTCYGVGRSPSGSNVAAVVSGLDCRGADFIVGCTSGAINLTATVSDGTNTYSECTGTVCGSATTGTYGHMMYAVNPTVSSNMTFTTGTSGDYSSLVVAGFSGVATTSPEQSHVNVTGGSNPEQMGSVTPATGNLILGCWAVDLSSGTQSMSPGSWIAGAYTDSGHAVGIGMGYYISDGTTVNPALSASSGTTYTAATFLNIKHQ